jgi:hypothetical protein
MRIAKISKELYRVYNNGGYKDVWVKNGIVLDPENECDILTEEERDFLLNYLLDNE